MQNVLNYIFKKKFSVFCVRVQIKIKDKIPYIITVLHCQVYGWECVEKGFLLSIYDSIESIDFVHGKPKNFY
jgi:hypothetical protein